MKIDALIEKVKELKEMNIEELHLLRNSSTAPVESVGTIHIEELHLLLKALKHKEELVFGIICECLENDWPCEKYEETLSDIQDMLDTVWTAINKIEL